MPTADLDRAKLEAFLAEPRNALVAGIRRDGRPQMTPNWFLWDGARFHVSTTRSRVKYAMFRRDPRVQLAIDDSTGFRYVVIDGTVEIGEDIDAGLPKFQALRAKHGRDNQTLEELRAEMIRDGRVLLSVTPDQPPERWLQMGFGK